MFELAATLRHPDYEDYFLDVLDRLSVLYPDHREELFDLLRTAGSAWTVDLDTGVLLRRVPDEMTAIYERVLNNSPASRDHMSDAWAAAFGLDPQATQAWNSSVKAVEAALHPIVTPNSTQSTLGVMRSDLRNAKADTFTFRAPGPDPKATVMGMLDLIPYEPDRHGSSDSFADMDVARVVVFQAASIVAAMQEGLISRRE